MDLFWPYGYGLFYWFTILLTYSIFQLIVSYGNKKISHRQRLLPVLFYGLPLLGLTGLFLFIYLWHGGLMSIYGSPVYGMVSLEWSEFFYVLLTASFLSGIALIVVAFTSRRGKHSGILTLADSIVGIINTALLHVSLGMDSYQTMLIWAPGVFMTSLLLLGLFAGGVYQSTKTYRDQKT